MKRKEGEEEVMVGEEAGSKIEGGSTRPIN